MKTREKVRRQTCLRIRHVQQHVRPANRNVKAIMLCNLTQEVHAAHVLALEHRSLDNIGLQCCSSLSELVEATGSQVSVAFAVTSGAHLDIDVEVTSPSGSVVYQSSREGEGKYVFAAEHDGTYKFCFSNKMSVVAHKAVRVVIDTGSIDDLQSLATKSNLDAVEQSIVSIAHMVRLVEFHQANYRQLHEQHLTTVAATNVQVRVWSMLECLSVFVVAGLQVLFIKRTFPATRASRIV